jgi:hypothetical protein
MTVWNPLYASLVGSNSTEEAVMYATSVTLGAGSNPFTQPLVNQFNNYRPGTIPDLAKIGNDIQAGVNTSLGQVLGIGAGSASGALVMSFAPLAVILGGLYIFRKDISNIIKVAAK